MYNTIQSLLQSIKTLLCIKNHVQKLLQLFNSKSIALFNGNLQFVVQNVIGWVGRKVNAVETCVSPAQMDRRDTHYYIKAADRALIIRANHSP